MHLRRVSLLVPILFVAGCLGAGTHGTESPSPSEAVPPPPKVLYSNENFGGCPPNAPTNTSPVIQKIEVNEGYDTLLIMFHVSGQGSLNAQLRHNEDSNKMVWENADKRPVTQIVCGQHSHSGDAESKTVEPGNYTLTLSYAGPVAAHIGITEKSSKSNATAPTHTHTPTP